MFIQIENLEDLELLYSFAVEHNLDNRGPFYYWDSPERLKFPIYIELSADGAFQYMGWQDNMCRVDNSYLQNYNSGISVADLLGIQQAYEYW
jgi:hypothetical protein